MIRFMKISQIHSCIIIYLHIEKIAFKQWRNIVIQSKV